MQNPYTENRIRYYDIRINKSSQIAEDYAYMFVYCLKNKLDSYGYDHKSFIEEQITLNLEICIRATIRLYYRYNIGMSA